MDDALLVVEYLTDDNPAFMDQIYLEVANALAGGRQWQETLKVLNAAEPSAHDLASVADALARRGHFDLAVDAANQALQPTLTPALPSESLSGVARALGRMGQFALALRVAADEPLPGRYQAYFWAADAAARRDHADAVRVIESLGPEHSGRVPLLAGSANAALAQSRDQDATPLLAQAADLIRRQASQDSIRAVTDVASLQAYAGASPSAIELIAHTVPEDEQYGPLARVVGVLAQGGRADEARATAELALDHVWRFGDAKRRIHACKTLTHLLAPYPDLSEQARSAADCAYSTYQELPQPALPIDELALASLSHDGSAVAEALALTSQSALATQICAQLRALGGRPDAFSLAPALAAGGDVPAALDLIEQLSPHNQAQPLERIIAALTSTGSPDDALALLDTITDPGQRSAALNHLAAAQAAQGRAEDAHRQAREAIRQARHAAPYVRPEQLLNAARTLHRIEKENEAREAALAAANEFRTRQSRGSGEVLLGCAQLLQRLGDDANSRRLLAESWLADGHPLSGWPLLTDFDAGVALALARQRWLPLPPTSDGPGVP